MIWGFQAASSPSGKPINSSGGLRHPPQLMGFPEKEAVWTPKNRGACSILLSKPQFRITVRFLSTETRRKPGRKTQENYQKNSKSSGGFCINALTVNNVYLGSSAYQGLSQLLTARQCVVEHRETIAVHLWCVLRPPDLAAAIPE